MKAPQVLTDWWTDMARELRDPGVWVLSASLTAGIGCLLWLAASTGLVSVQ